MVRVAHITDVKEPNVTDIEDLVVWSSEELFEVLGRLYEVSEPDHSGHIGLSAGKMNTSKLDISSVLLELCLYRNIINSQIDS